MCSSAKIDYSPVPGPGPCIYKHGTNIDQIDVWCVMRTSMCDSIYMICKSYIISYIYNSSIIYEPFLENIFFFCFYEILHMCIIVNGGA